MANQTIEQITKAGVGDTGQQKFTTTQFAKEFQKSQGRAPTQEELGEFTQVRASFRQPVQPTQEPKQEQKTEIQPTKTEIQKTKPAEPVSGTVVPKTTEFGFPEGSIENQLAQQYQNDAKIAQTELDTFQQRFDELTARMTEQQQQVANGIKAAYRRRKQQVQALTDKRVSNVTTAQLRTGMARYAPALAEGAISAEERAGQQKIADLDAEMFQLIQEAQLAATKEDFAMLNQKMNTMAQLRNEQSKALEKQYQLTRDYDERMARKIEFERDQKRALFEDLDLMVSVGKEITDQEKQYYDDVLGLGEGFTDSYLEANKAMQERELATDIFEQDLKINDFLLKVPEGRAVQLGGNIYEGFKVGNVKYVQETDEYGNVVVAKYDDGGNLIGIDELGSIGKPTQTAEQRAKTMLEIQRLQNELYQPAEGQGRQIYLDNKEAANLNKEIVNSDDYKGLVSAREGSQLLQNFERLFGKMGTERFGKGKAQLGSAYTQVLLNMKELFNLGVLNGPDLELMESVISDPTSTIRNSKVQAGIDQAKNMLVNRVVDTYKRLITSYDSYNPDQLTNLNNAKRMYDSVVDDHADFILDQRVEANPDILNQVYLLKEQDPNLLPSDIIKILDQADIQVDQGFSQPLSMGKNGSTVSKIAQAIGEFESGGNYDAVGPKTASGDRAYGRYQIMGNNIPGWSKEALGRSVSVEEFKNNPEIQDKVAEHKMKQYYDRYGTVEDVAVAWFAGPGAVGKNSQARDVIGTSVPQYARNVKSIFNRITA